LQQPCNCSQIDFDKQRVHCASAYKLTELETLTLMVANKLSEEIAKSITFLKVSPTTGRNWLGSDTFIRLYIEKASIDTMIQKNDLLE